MKVQNDGIPPSSFDDGFKGLSATASVSALKIVCGSERYLSEL